MSSNGLKQNRHSFITKSAEETESLGRFLANKLPPNSIVCFFGDLGAGKTTFIKGLIQEVLQEKQDVVSPTFVYLNIYQGRRAVYHFDLYRLRDIDEFLSMGFDEFLSLGGICCIEWSERIKCYLPDNCVKVSISHKSETERKIEIESG